MGELLCSNECPVATCLNKRPRIIQSVGSHRNDEAPTRSKPHRGGSVGFPEAADVLVEWIDEDLDHRLGVEGFHPLADVLGQPIAHFWCALWLFKQPSHFDDDLGTEAIRHHVGREQAGHFLLVSQAQFRNSHDGGNDVLVQPPKVVLCLVCRQAPHFDYRHYLSFR